MSVIFSQLESELLQFITHLKECGLEADHALFLSLFEFGFRIKELENCHSWYIRPGNLIECTVSKNSNNRFIDQLKAPPLLIRSIQNNTNYIFRSSYHSYKRLFDARICSGGYRIGGKRASTHIFRHYVMKRMFNNGSTYAAIASYFGLTSVFIVMAYVHSDVKYYNG